MFFRWPLGGPQCLTYLFCSFLFSIVNPQRKELSDYSLELPFKVFGYKDALSVSQLISFTSVLDVNVIFTLIIISYLSYTLTREDVTAERG